jgi:hypothetical protein
MNCSLIHTLRRACLACFFGALLVASLLAPGAAAQAHTEHPGYVPLGPTAEWFRGEAQVEVNIAGALLGLVSEAARGDDPEFADLLEKLVAVQVRAYEQRRTDFGGVSGEVEAWTDRLEAEGWSTVLSVREDAEHVEMLVRASEAGILGMMVMAVSPEDGESVFVNIVGEIDPAEIGRIGRRFRIRSLENL